MGFLNAIEGLAGQQGQNDNTKVAGGVMQALDEHPGGLAGIMQEFRHNGMNEPVQQWSTGQPATASPEQIQQGLGNSGRQIRGSALVASYVREFSARQLRGQEEAKDSSVVAGPGCSARGDRRHVWTTS